MSTRSLEQGGQVPMLQPDPDTMSERVLPPPEEPTFKTIEGGPSVRLADYYSALEKTMGYFGNINTGENFRARFRGAAGGSQEDEAVLKSQVSAKYGSMAKANEKYDKSEEGQDTLEELARKQFSAAFGRNALVGSGIRTHEEVDNALEKYYANLKKRYAGIPNAKAKNSFRGKMGRRAKRYQQAEDR